MDVMMDDYHGDVDGKGVTGANPFGHEKWNAS
jgi:hypothetical protein